MCDIYSVLSWPIHGEA